MYLYFLCEGGCGCVRGELVGVGVGVGVGVIFEYFYCTCTSY